MITNFCNSMHPQNFRQIVPQLFLIIVLLLSTTISSKAFAPPKIYQIKGFVADSVSGDGIPYITISVQSAQKGIVKRLAADAAGNFSFSLDTIGKYDIIFQSIGYVTTKKPLTLNEQNLKFDFGTISLNPGVEKIGEVSVVAQKPLVRTEVDKIIYSAEVDPESKTSTALEMLRKVPLVTVDGEDNIQVKGNTKEAPIWRWEKPATKLIH